MDMENLIFQATINGLVRDLENENLKTNQLREKNKELRKKNKELKNLLDENNKTTIKRSSRKRR